MIYLKIRGRLGNQFFQFAAVKAYQLKYFPNEEICIDFSDLKKLGSEKEGFCNSLKYFNLPKYTECNKVKANLLQKILIFLMKIPNAFFRIIGFATKADIISYNFEKNMQPLLNKFGIFYMIHGFYKFENTNAKNKIFYGNFESDKFFDDYRDLIIDMYKPKQNMLESNEKMYKKIISNNSICISIRRGDFVDNEEISKVHYVCDSNYFYNAILLMKTKIKNPLFVVFSDDIEWVKENMDFGTETIYESGNDPLWEKVRLMASCKNFIISNSTFSWWVQYLSTNKNKVVIAPKKWKNISYMKDTEKLDIYQNNWIKI